jgi:hypothetical protein
VSELVADCPRCGASRITFDLTAQTRALDVRYNWQHWYEAFCVCRHCGRGTIFFLADAGIDEGKIIRKLGLANVEGAVNHLVRVEDFVSQKDEAGVPPPEHTPKEIAAVFWEGATCLAVRCFNAAGTMFRLCVDLATRPLLPPQGDADGPSAKIRRDLGLRLPWLFDHGLLPTELRELSTCIREDGNDGAHQGTLGKADAADLLDFTTSLLERLYTEPERLRLARERRDKRREG